MEDQLIVATLFIMCGFPFSGKSTLATRIVEECGLQRVSVDEINAELGVGANPEQPITQAEWDRTYTIFFRRIDGLLRRGRSVIADTAGYSRSERDQLRNVARSSGADAVVIHVQVPVETSRQRLLDNRQTKARHDVRDEDYDNVIRNFEEPAAPERVLVFGAEMDCSVLLQKVKAQI